MLDERSDRARVIFGGSLSIQPEKLAESFRTATNAMKIGDKWPKQSFLSA